MSLHLSDFRALLFDVDNTLTTTKKVISDKVISSLQTLSDKSYICGVCTAKSHITLASYVLPYFSPHTLHITASGSQITSVTGEVMWEQPLSADIVEALVAKLKTVSAQYFITQADAVYAEEKLMGYLTSHSFGFPVKPLSQLTTWKTPLMGIYYLTPEIEAILAEFSHLLTIKRMHHHKSGQPYCDITAAGVNKAGAFLKWCELQKIEPSQVIGFGDSDNDVEFLQEVGYAVAMGNAVPEIKAVADRVIGHTDEDGLGLYLESILNGGEL